MKPTWQVIITNKDENRLVVWSVKDLGLIR